MEANQCSLVVEPSYPDLVINVGEVTLGEENRNNLQKVQRDQEKERVLRAACALLNSGGGVIRMAKKDEHLVDMGLDLEMSLRDLIQSSDLQAFFETKQQGRCFYIFVKSWSSGLLSEDGSVKPRLCSLRSSLRRRSQTSILLMNSREAFCFLKKKKNAKILEEGPFHKVHKGIHQELRNSDPADPIFQKDYLEYGEILPFPESQSVEFKRFSTKHIQEYVKKIIPEYVPAFANTDGGYLFIGVDDKSKKVLGCAKKNVNPDSLRSEIVKTIHKLPCVHFCKAQCQITFTLKIVDVLAKGELHGYACMIRVEPFCCAVFSEAPNSWIVEDKYVCSLTTEKWVGMMTDTDPDLLQLSEDFECQLSLSSGPPLSRPVYSKKGLQHKKELQQLLFSVPPGHLRYTPESLWRDLTSEHEGLQELINKQMQPFSQGIVILSRSWAVDLNLQEKPGVICDALLIAQNSTPILYTVLREQDAEGQDYCTRTAFTLKQNLVNVGGYTGKVCVRAKVLCLSPENSAEALEAAVSPMDYPTSYRLAGTQHMEALLQSLVIVLLGFRSLLSDQLGCEVLNLLTAQQYEIFSRSLRKNRELFVHGLPGSGKTIMAMKIMEKIRNVFHCEEKRILYICENQPLRNFISDKNICQAETRKTFIKGKFGHIQHIVIDEAQNFRSEDGDWYGKAKTITRRAKDGPGILWIFLDYFQTSHLNCSGLPLLSDQYPREELTRIVRNADPIAKYLQKEMQVIRNNPSFNIPPGSLEVLLEAEWSQGVPGTLQIKKHLTVEQIVTFVADTCRFFFERGYSPKDVAVLVSTAKEVERYKYELLKAMRKKRVVQLRDACDMLGDHIVLDSVRRFSGLERNIVFGIHPRTSDPAILPNILICLASRAKQHLYIFL
uniref:Schlafen family member 13 n=1 Tax=Macaca nemestrina TaxID=9545 RepID=A0A2K6C7X3_MACNE|nr:schlafen family member 11 [Macaca nemestrina]XP_011745648.1 schlafen family member 11 [Macaca nemestrina]XP_011745649.1 schlafen family member 11 [Macaca nemestrina]XP_024649675.1 schlafen family member 11 [Macaca nemestrina]